MHSVDHYAMYALVGTKNICELTHPYVGRHKGSNQPVWFALAPSWLTEREQGGVVIFLGFLGQRDVAGSDDTGLAPDGHLDDSSMVCIWSEQDDEIVSGHSSF